MRAWRKLPFGAGMIFLGLLAACGALPGGQKAPTPLPSPAPSPTPTASATYTPTPTPTATATCTPTPSPTASATPSTSPEATQQTQGLSNAQVSLVALSLMNALGTPSPQDVLLWQQVLAKLEHTPGGQRYVEYYHRYAPALARLVQQDPQAAAAFAAAWRQSRPALQAWVTGAEARVSAEAVAAVHRFALLVIQRGAPSLAATVRQEAQRIPWDRLPGMRVQEVERLLLSREVPLGTPRP